MGDFASDDFNGFGAFQDFGGQPGYDWSGWWQPPPWQRNQAMASGMAEQNYRPRPFPVNSGNFKRPAPWPMRPAYQPKQRVESNEKSFTMPDDAPENFVQLVSTGRCELCKASISSVVNAEMHYNGKTHQKRLKENGMSVGEYFSGILKIQPASVPQADKLESASKDSPQLKGPSGLPDLPDGLESDCCRLCGVTFTNTIQAHQHYAGKKHRANAINGRKIAIARQAAPKVFRCELCDIVTNSQGALQSHISGQKHSANERNRRARMALQKQQPEQQQQTTQEASQSTAASTAKSISAFLSNMRSTSF